MSEPGMGAPGNEPAAGDAAAVAGTAGLAAPDAAAATLSPGEADEVADETGAPVPGALAAATPIPATPTPATPIPATQAAAIQAATGTSPATPSPGEADEVADEPEPERPTLLQRVRSSWFLRSRRGLFALLLVIGGFGFAGIWTGVSLITWTETADFCGRCHQMGPELTAYEAGPHRDVTCGECHVSPGIEGWVQAKINGTKQLLQVITGLYPKPVPPPDHSNLPSVKDTCLRCHSLQRLATNDLITRAAYSEDQANTRQFVGLMIRPSSGDVFDIGRSVHWHVIENVDYWSADENAAKIDVVVARHKDGTVRTFISQPKVKVAEDVQPDVDAITAAEPQRTMDCITCHNRIGHPIPNPRRSIDQAMVEGQIDPTLPYIKREAMRILWSSFPDEAAAAAEADKLQSFYKLQYPQVAASDAASITASIAEIKTLYGESATPEMKVSAATYPDNLGHMDFAGCFRCHDGGHYLVQNGAVTKEVIPATCDTCHTYPQIGTAVASLPLGEPPKTHGDPLYVFNHKNVAQGVDPGTQTCGECHARDYCSNCHKTGAISVDHEQMLTNHAASIRQSGNQACAYCHQPVYCARCHSDKVLPVTSPFLGGGQAGAVTEGVEYPLQRTAAAVPAAPSTPPAPSGPISP